MLVRSQATTVASVPSSSQNKNIRSLFLVVPRKFVVNKLTPHIFNQSKNRSSLLSIGKKRLG
jgi:hypothetical protein